MAEVICPNCKTSFKVGNGENIVDTSKLSGTVELVPETIRNENKGVNTMDLGTINFKGMSDSEKNEVLKAMGFNPFDFKTQRVDKSDPMVQEIYANGYVKNEKLHRRWITAQTMRLLGWYSGVKVLNSYWGTVYYQDYWTKNVNEKYNWTYIFKMLANEYNSLAHLKGNSFREEIFNPNQLHTIFNEYIKYLREYFDSLRTKKCKGVPYKTIGGRNVFVSDFEKKIITPIKTFLADTESQYFVKIKEYRGISNLLHIFLERYFIKLPNSTPLSKTWVDMFKKAGAYYTMENLVKYSGLKLMNYETDEPLNRDDSLKYLEECKSQQGYQLLALLKRSLEANDFKFSEVI